MTNSIIQRAKNEALSFFNSCNEDQRSLGDKEYTLSTMLVWLDDELTRITGASNILHYEAMIEATKLLIEESTVKTITTVIDLLDLVPRGTEFAAFDLLMTLGTMNIQTPAGDMVTITTKHPITVNGVDFTYTTTDNQVIVSDINNDIVGIATREDHLTHISIDDSNGYTVNDLYEQTNEHVANYIAAVSFN